MGLIRQSAAGFLKDAIVLDLGDLARQGERIKTAAETHAQGVVKHAATERMRILEGAASEGRREGFEQGRKEGFEAGRVEGRAAALEEHRVRLAEVEKAWIAAVELFEQQRRAIVLEAQRDVLLLALDIASRVVKRTVETDAGVASAQLESALTLVTRQTRLLVRVNPEDEPVLREAIPALLERFSKAEHIELKADQSVSKGSCIARTAAGGVIDATIETQFQRLADAVVPNRARPPEPQPPNAVGEAR